MTVHLLFRSWSENRPPRNYEHPLHSELPSSGTSFFLLANESWDDFGFQTMFLVHAFDGDAWVYVGYVGIALFGKDRGSTYEALGRPDRLAALPSGFYSLGGEAEYYEVLLRVVGPEIAREFLEALNDIVLDPELRSRAVLEAAYDASLTRSNSAIEALDKAPAILGLSRTEVRDRFRAVVHMEAATAPHEFDFDFNQAGPASSRMNVLVGLNGTGKTQSMASLARLISRVMSHDGAMAVEVTEDWLEPRPSIYGVVAISFSAFDDFVVPTEDQSKRFRYTYCGLKSLQGGESKDRRSLVLKEVESRFDQIESSSDRRKVLELLEPSLEGIFDLEQASESGRLPAHLLSAGQRIVLAAACELVRNVGDRTLVMMDEPEIHLHPQLLSGLIAWTLDLLEATDSFAIVATHSPSVVQQVRSSAVHVLKRDGNRPRIVRPTIETFGANLTEIAHEVFENREGDRSYQDELERLLRQMGSVEAVNELFGNRLGMNALIYLRSLVTE